MHTDFGHSALELIMSQGNVRVIGQLLINHQILQAELALVPDLVPPSLSTNFQDIFDEKRGSTLVTFHFILEAKFHPLECVVG